MKVKGQHENAEHIVTPSACDLTEGQPYSLHCSEAHKILPEVSISNQNIQSVSITAVTG